MPVLKTIQVEVSERQQKILEHIIRSRTKPSQLVQRARLILLSGQGEGGESVGGQVNLSRSQIWTWKKRWTEAQKQLQELEGTGLEEQSLQGRIEALLEDRPRSGCPATFEVETILKILLVAQEEPSESGRPVSHWSPRELRQEVMKRGIVETISQRSIGRFLKGSQSATSKISKMAESKGGFNVTIKQASGDNLSVIPRSTATSRAAGSRDQYG